MDGFTDESRPDTEILQLLGLCLNNNDFVFDKKDYLQIQVRLRSLDDIIGATLHVHESFQDFTQTLNNHHPSIKIRGDWIRK